ncbi:cysteine desulfurase [Robertmurraya siralis]|uniref:cysteine desulfurase n=1 Tax=Robertmurraya siralis TaxID=77777 RepID=A0A919WMD4_9BACI|nr:aminotransferase class V-fold PLP-dependent enzyme [Robertmurraya siralis]GIN64367.1 cysteine desulfurase [Robertmurraya siralis]
MKAYLDNAATSFPKPPHSLERVFETISRGVGTPGRGMHEISAKANDEIVVIRKQLAKFFGVLEDFRVVFTYSATDALNMAIKGFVRDGDHVIISSMEHNSVLRPLRGLESQGKIVLDIIPCDKKGYLNTKALYEKINEKTRLVVVSHASNVTGAIQPIEEIGKEVRKRGAFLLVDAAQTAGVLPLHLEKQHIDMLVFAGHKGLFALQGTGGLVIGSRIEGLKAWREGGTGFDSKSESQPVNWPEAFEAGTHNIPGILSLGEGLTFIENTGIETIADTELAHLRYLWEKLSYNEEVILYGPSPDEARVAVLSFTIKGWDPEDIGHMLNQNYGIYVRTGLHCAPSAHKTIGTYGDDGEGTIRVSPGFFTTKLELKEFLKAIKNITSTKVGWY